jgi:clan AA aspartic protease (TIGR02281 family)
MFIVLFVLGVAVGWMLRGGDEVFLEEASEPFELVPDESEAPNFREMYSRGELDEIVRLSQGHADVIHILLQNSTAQKARLLLGKFMAVHGPYFHGLMRLANLEKQAGEFESALALMEKADLLSRTQSEQDSFSALLLEITDAYAKELLAVENFAPLDALYQRITLNMPEQAFFFLKLGLLRIRMGNYDAALAPLSQIENHMLYGEEARELISQTQVDETLGSLEILPLKSNGVQFVVEALIDRRHRINLLIDTGAAMTVIDASVLQSMGYNLNGKQQGLFTTAGGVVEAPVVSIEQLALGSAVAGPMAVGALSLSMPGGIDGLLGMNFLRHYDFRIDQDSKTLHLNSER